MYPGASRPVNTDTSIDRLNKNGKKIRGDFLADSLDADRMPEQKYRRSLTNKTDRTPSQTLSTEIKLSSATAEADGLCSGRKILCRKPDIAKY